MNQQQTNVNCNNVNKNPATNPERNVHLNESYEDYCVRRNEMNKTVKALKKGKLFWNSEYVGTYENSEKRKLRAERKARREAKRA